MRSLKALALAATFLSGVSHAANDKPAIGPAPAWVKPVPLPAKPDKADEAPIRVMLADQQTRLEAGRNATYVDVALQIQSPQGLSAGNLSFPWNPETDELTVHKLVIHRDGTTIDVLAGGQTFTVVRREPNLESATLDGVLTANIQPEGLQVGDILEYAATVVSSDPVLKGHVEQAGATWNAVPFVRTHLSVQWPASLAVALRQNGALPTVKPVKSGTMTGVELSMDNVAPVIPPRGAPARFAMGRVIEFSDFKSWADAGALMAPLYDVAARVPAEGPLRVELEKIKAATADPVKRTEMALALVQDRVRYVALLMGAGGLTPAKAEETWGRRYGDCKAKTALLLALLHELGIEAEPVAANAVSGDGIDQRLPMIGVFNHVLVRAHIGGRAYWLDGTRSGDTSLARLRTPDFGWGLPLVAKGAALVRMLPDPLDEPGYDLAIDIDARSGLSVPAQVKAQVLLRGDAAIGTRHALANMAADARDNALREYWKERLDDLEIAKVTSSFDTATGIETLVMEGKTKMDWSDSQYWTDSTRVGFEADFSRTAGPNSDAPFAMDYPSFSRTVETIQLPPGFTQQNIFRPEPIDETVAGIEYRRKSSLADNVFRIERTVRAVAPEFAAKDAPAAEKRLKELHDMPVSVRMPNNYRMTAAELDEEFKTTPTTVEGFIRRSGLLLGQHRSDDARAALESALKLDPNNERAKLAILTLFLQMQDIERASRYASGIDLSKVKERFLAWTIGGLALMKNDPERAIAGYSRSLELKADQPQVLVGRAQAYLNQGNRDAANADVTAAIKLNPKERDAVNTIITILQGLGRRDEVIKQVEDLLAANPADGPTHAFAARMFRWAGQSERALAEIEKAMPSKPDARSYLNRAGFRPKADLTGRQSDIDTALKLAPNFGDAQRARAALQLERRDFAGAIATFSALIEVEPNNRQLHNIRGIAYAKAGDTIHAEQDFIAARKGVVGADLLNDMCYEKAMAGVALHRALEECDAALKSAPEAAAALDSKAFVLLRMGRFDEAIILFDKALAKSSKYAASLYGRAIAWSRKGDKAKAQADRDAALQISPNVAWEFEDNGVKFEL